MAINFSSNMLDPMNVASPLSPLNPLNPVNPASPLNPLNMDDTPAPPRDRFKEGMQDLQDDLKLIAPPGSDWLAGKNCENIEKPGVASLEKTSHGFALHVIRHSCFGGATRLVQYMFDRTQQTVDVQEESLRGSVGRFLHGESQHDHYILDVEHKKFKQA